MSRIVKKLVTVLANSSSTTVVSKKAELVLSSEAPTPITNFLPPLEHVPFIHYQVQFKKDQTNIQALINSGSEVNAMTRFYIAKLGLKVQSTDVKV